MCSYTAGEVIFVLHKEKWSIWLHCNNWFSNLDHCFHHNLLKNYFYSGPNWLTVTCPLCHTQQWWANITIQFKYFNLRLNWVTPKWSSSYSRVHYLVFISGQMVPHTNLSNTLLADMIFPKIYSRSWENGLDK